MYVYNLRMTEQKKEIMILHYATLFRISMAYVFFSGMVKKHFNLK